MAHQKRQIAPRLASGDAREKLFGRLPEEIKIGLRAIARMERKSVSWVMEEVFIDYFGFRQPRYVREVKPRRHQHVRRMKAVA